MKLRLTARAHRDLTNIVSFIEKENPAAAATVARRIEAALNIIVEIPMIGRHSVRSPMGVRVFPGAPIFSELSQASYRQVSGDKYTVPVMSVA